MRSRPQAWRAKMVEIIMREFFVLEKGFHTQTYDLIKWDIRPANMKSMSGLNRKTRSGPFHTLSIPKKWTAPLSKDDAMRKSFFLHNSCKRERSFSQTCDRIRMRASLRQLSIPKNWASPLSKDGAMRKSFFCQREQSFQQTCESDRI